MRQSLCFCINLLLLSVNFVSACQDGECRILAFPSFLFYADKRLLNHTIRTEQVKDLSLCELLCYYEPNCVSMNFKTTENAEGIFSCELNNSTHRRHDDEFMDNYGYLYREAESACDADPCENDATCQAGYTQKKYRCLCPSGFTGENCESDINECEEGTHDCDVNADCTNTRGAFTCTCKIGYEADGDACKDENECTDGSHDCGANQDCVNSEGSFSCIPVLSDYTVIVQTADKFGAGTAATVKIKVEGTKGNAERNLEGSFERGDHKTFHFSDWDIGYVKGLEIYRGNEGLFPGWDLEYIIIEVVGATDSIFNYHEKVTFGWTALTLTCPDGHHLNDQQYCSLD